MTAVSATLRAARMSVLGHALRRTDLSFPLTLEFPGDGEHGSTEVRFGDRNEIERTLTDARVIAVNDGLALYTLPDGGFILAQPTMADPWGRTRERRRRHAVTGWPASAGTGSKESVA